MWCQPFGLSLQSLNINPLIAVILYKYTWLESWGSGVVRMVDACQMQGVPVIVDRDLATLYGVETKRMNEQVRRNLNRFPSRFRFQLTKEEVNEVVANCDHLLSIKYSSTHFTGSPYCSYPTTK